MEKNVAYDLTFTKRDDHKGASTILQVRIATGTKKRPFSDATNPRRDCLDRTSDESGAWLRHRCVGSLPVHTALPASYGEARLSPQYSVAAGLPCARHPRSGLRWLSFGLAEASILLLIDGESPVTVYRDLRDLSKSEPARAADMHRIAVHKIETGQANGSVESMTRLTVALRVPIDDLVKQLGRKKEADRRRGRSIWAESVDSNPKVNNDCFFKRNIWRYNNV